MPTVSQDIPADILDLISWAAKEKYVTEKQSSRFRKLLEAEGVKKRRPGPLTLHIKDCSEKALQRAIYLSSCSHMGFSDHRAKKVFWGDVEVPVRSVGKSARGSCFDLVGSTKENGGIDVFCELKVGKSGDNPIFAALELLAYHKVSKNHGEICFHKNSVAHILGWKKAAGTQPDLIVAADSAYWSRRRGWGKPIQALIQKRDNRRVKLSFFEIRFDEKSDFKKQRQGQRYYTPCLGPCEWREVYGRA